MNILLIGLGRWGKNHLRVLRKIVENVYVADSDGEQLRAIHGSVSTNYLDFLKESNGVVIATPTDSHLEIAKECLSQGKDVFVEKPIALNTQQAREMISATNGQILQVGHIYRYHPVTTKAKELLHNGKIGKVLYSYGHFLGFKRPRTDVGVTQTDAIHYFDLFNYLFDERPIATVSIIKHYLKLGLDDTSVSTIEYPGGKIATVETSYISPENRRDVFIMGSQGSLYLDFRANSLHVCECRHERQTDGKYIAVDGPTKTHSIDCEEPLQTELASFLRSIRTREKPLSNGHTAYDALRIVEACYESSKSQRRVDLTW